MRILSVIILLFVTAMLSGQNAKLADQYYRNGEYEKSEAIYQKLYEKNRGQTFYFNRYVESMLNLEKYSQCEQVIRRRIREAPKDSRLYVTLGQMYERMMRPEDAEKQYQKAIDKLQPDRGAVVRLGNSFNVLTKYDYAIQAYEKGIRMLKDTIQFSYQLADLYSKKGDMENMIRYYLYSLDQNPSRLSNLKTQFLRKLTDEDYPTLQRLLYERIQAGGDNIHFIELLEWTFIQDEDYNGAFRQARALDRRLGENGARVYNIGNTAYNAGDYETAVRAFEYIVENKGINSSYYVASKQQLLDSKRLLLYTAGTPTQEQLADLENEYIAFTDEFGKTPQTAPVMAELAKFQARFLHDVDKAIRVLEEVIDIPGLNRYLLANVKLELGDYYLLRGDRWESTLLYSQVDKEFPEELLGEEARFRNAKLSYYVGDFEWAQAQFDILKASTSKLISNDAIDLSVFITDNLGLDTTPVPLQMYARADLLVFQGQYESAFALLDTLTAEYPEHGLQDDLLYMKARVWSDRGKYEQAEMAYQKIISDYSEEIRYDNALYELASLYDYEMDQPEKAQELYEKLFVETTDSVFATEARKRYRYLRGDFDSKEERFMKGLQ